MTPSYTPDIGEVAWAPIREFVTAVVDDVVGKIPYPTDAVKNAVAHHVHWCVNVSALPLRRTTIFQRDVIGAAVYAMPTTNTSTQGRRRSLLLRVGESLGVIATTAPLPPLPAATPSTPYSALEVELIVQWVTMQRDHVARSADALVALGLGAGLATRDLAAVRAVDIDTDGRSVHTGSRLVPVLPEWRERLRALASIAKDAEAAIFRPGTSWSKNVVTVFVARSVGVGLRPSTQRMRATWLVQHMAMGTPMQDLLSAAGLASMDALVRYERFLPPPAPVDHAGMPR